MDNHQYKKGKSEKFDEEFDLETSDRSRMQSLQALDTVFNTLSDPSLEDSLLKSKFNCLSTYKSENDPETLPEEHNENFYRKLFHEDHQIDCEDIEKKCSFLIVDSEECLDDKEICENYKSFLEDSYDRLSLNTPSFTYSRTETGAVNSVFNTFLWQSGLMKSLPQSRNQSEYLGGQAWETFDPCFIVERKDIGKYDKNELFMVDRICKSSLNCKKGEVEILDRVNRTMDEKYQDKEISGFRDRNISFEDTSNCCQCRYDKCIIL
ncbi:hypothetical protein SteCoe_13006 [Stentor coeruleus]|uniref:Uncharacterized protein n=1 Tax=Stentor coeruleus TaxID=5963 RepID=A0A1R2C9I1_9CILI|nr:hypothetical protein SteCoe_13006 [Stentor coeruleus]